MEAFIQNRLEEMRRELLKTSGEYVSARTRQNEVFDNVDSILCCDTQITITAGDCTDICEYIEALNDEHAICQSYAYLKGQRDCVRFLKSIGIFG